jgi:hypothetical protein
MGERDEITEPFEPPRHQPEAASVADDSRALAERLSSPGPEDAQAKAAAFAIDETGPLIEPEPEATSRPAFPREPATPQRPLRRRWPLLLAAVVVLLVVAALSTTGYLAYSNKSRADRWEARSLALERNVDELNVVLVERSNALDARTRELNRIARTVKAQQRALRRSEADVSSLSSRQRALAAEKAAVEDSRAGLAIQASSLEDVADGFVDCKDGLVDLLGYILDEDYFSANAVIGGVADDCQYAESALSSYNSIYP